MRLHEVGEPRLLTGSARTIRAPGQCALRNRPTPVIVPPVPTPETNAPTVSAALL